MLIFVVLGLLLASLVPPAAGASRRTGGAPDAAAVPEAPALRAGAAAVLLELPPGTPLGGYGSGSRRRRVPDVFGRSPHTFWLTPAQGARDPIMARVLALEAPPARLLWIVLDLVIVDEALVGDVGRRLRLAGLDYPTVIVSASHTHSGPGAFVDSTLFEFLALDRLDREVRERLLGTVVAAAAQADRNKTPARLGVGSAPAPPVIKSRLRGPLDQEIALLKFVRPDGSPIALVWNFAIHGTMLGTRNLRLSGDVMGLASQALERDLGVPALFVNGAVGDVSPAGHGEQAVVEVGRRLADAVAAAWVRTDARADASLSIAHGTVDLGGPHASIRNCLGRWVPRFLRAPLGTVLPPSATLTAVALGEGAWVTVPGELQSQLGRVVKEAGRRHFALPFVAGLSNGYLGYFLTAEAYRRPGYIECASFYGEEAGARIAAEAAALLEKLARQRAMLAPNRPQAAQKKHGWTIRVRVPAPTAPPAGGRLRKPAEPFVERSGTHQRAGSVGSCSSTGFTRVSLPGGAVSDNLEAVGVTAVRARAVPAQSCPGRGSKGAWTAPEALAEGGQSAGER